MKLLLLGHSFVRRLKDSVMPEARHIEVDRRHAKAFSEKLTLSDHFPETFTICLGVNLIRHLFDKLDDIKVIHPCTVMLEIGSNDLANMSSWDSNHCLYLANMALEFTMKLRAIGAKMVIMNSVIPRYARLCSTPDIFLRNCGTYNHILKNFCDTENGIFFCKLRGFYAPNEPSTRPKWTADGIHCDSTHGQAMYRSRIRHNLIYQSCLQRR